MRNALKVGCLLLVLLYGVSASGQVKTLSPVEQRANDVMNLIGAQPAEYEKYFSKSLLVQVPPEKLTEIFASFRAGLGRVLKIEPAGLESPLKGKFNFIFEKNASVPVSLTVEEAEPHLIVGLWLGNPVSLSASLDAVVAEFKSLPGESSFLVVKLAGDKIEPVAAYHEDRELAIGSAFKLYVLSELIRSINKGERKWTDVLTLKPESVSLPSGMLQKWPAGSPLTLHTLASLMISISDNTAADQLLFHLGRENVEKVMAVTGHSKPELNMPFLSTLELFRLKGEPGRANARTYLSKTAAAERREFLSGTVAHIKRETLSFPVQPTNIETLEWFASTTDLCRAMNWIRLNTEAAPGMAARDILSINSGIAIPEEKWKYAGYKGGSEPGVMNMTYLLQSTKGDWYALSASWNNREAPVDEGKFAGLVGRAIQLIP